MKIRSKNTVAEEQRLPMRFLATIRSIEYAEAVAMIASLDLDRLPDANGQVRFIVSTENIQQLLDRRIEVTLLEAIPIAPLSPSLIMTDKQSNQWLETQVKGVPRKGGK